MIKNIISSSGSGGGVSANVYQQNNERLARASLMELLRFHEALEQEIALFEKSQLQNEVEQQTLQYMRISKTLFDEAMDSMKTQGGNEGRLAMIKFADSVQDLMGYIHKTSAN